MEAVKADSVAASVVFQRVTEGETLRQIAADWGVPRGRFTEWYTTQHAELYDSALKVRADQLAHDALAVASTPQRGVITKTKGDGTVEVIEEDMLGHRKLYAETMLRLAGKWDRQRYGEHTKVEHGGHVTGLIAVLSSLPSGRVVEQAPEESEKPDGLI